MRGSRPVLVAALVAALLAPAAPALAHHRSGPCDVHRREDETVQRQMRRMIRCAVGRWDVRGGVRKAVCIAAAESGLNPDAVSPGGSYLGLYQHIAEAWPERYDAWTRPAWDLKESALSGRTNTIVTIRMVSENGWGPWSGVGDC